MHIQMKHKILLKWPFLFLISLKILWKKTENAGHQHFLLFLQCFLKPGLCVTEISVVITYWQQDCIVMQLFLGNAWTFVICVFGEYFMSWSMKSSFYTSGKKKSMDQCQPVRFVLSDVGQSFFPIFGLSKVFSTLWANPLSEMDFMGQDLLVIRHHRHAWKPLLEHDWFRSY